MANWHLGTVGFSYKDWAGVFYPARTPPRDYLTHYSQIFDAVELDASFHAVPPLASVQRWAAMTPNDFNFCVKTPRQVTHELGLVGAAGAMSAFLERMRHLGSRLGPVLIQLPPNFSAAQTPTLAEFLAALPTDLRYAVEFRHPSWYTPETAELLRAHAAAWVAVDYPTSPRHLAVTSDFLYVRWLGQHGRFSRKDREQTDVRPALEWWAGRLQDLQAGVQTIYGFFNNDFSGHSPRTCNTFKEIVGLPVRKPQLPTQGRLL